MRKSGGAGTFCLTSFLDSCIKANRVPTSVRRGSLAITTSTSDFELVSVSTRLRK